MLDFQWYQYQNVLHNQRQCYKLFQKKYYYKFFQKQNLLQLVSQQKNASIGFGIVFSIFFFCNSSQYKKMSVSGLSCFIIFKYKIQNKPGLLFIGQCKNQQCKNTLTWSALGLKSYDMVSKLQNTPCPDCGKNLKMVPNAVIMNCLLVGKGKKITDNEEEVFQHEIFSTDSYIHFGQHPNEMARWKYLTLKCTQPKMCPQKHTLTRYQKCYTDWICKNCQEQFQGNQKSKYCAACRYHLCWDCM